MRVALVNPPPRTESERHWARFPVLGLAYVAAALRADGHEVRLFDGKLAGLAFEEIVAGVSRAGPDLIGITCMTVEFPEAVRLATALKQTCAAPVIVGGAHINAVGQQALEECTAFDYACVDEGEQLTVELARALSGHGDPAAIPGLAYRRYDSVLFTGKRPYPSDYDALSFPAWDLFNVGEQIPILTHRGCPFLCNFCGHNSGFKPRYRTPANVLTEISDVLARFKPRTIRFEDETFGLNLPRTRQILHGILERGFQREVSFSAQTRVDRTDLDFIRLLKACNFETLEIGVESGNAAVLDRIQKGITLAQVERAVALAKQEKIRVWCKFILGHPFETHADIRDTLRFITRLNPDQLSVSVMTPFPGTPIFEMAIRGEGGYRMLSADWGRFDKYSSGVLELETVSLGQLKAYQLLAYVMLYAGNARVADLTRLLMRHQRMAIEMMVDTARNLVTGKRQAVPVCLPRPVALSEEWHSQGARVRQTRPFVSPSATRRQVPERPLP